MVKTIHGLDEDGNEDSHTFAEDCNLYIETGNVDFDIDITDPDGNTTEYEVVLAEGGPILRPRRPRG